jgi:hypothetical protein
MRFPRPRTLVRLSVRASVVVATGLVALVASCDFDDNNHHNRYPPYSPPDAAYPFPGADAAFPFPDAATVPDAPSAPPDAQPPAPSMITVLSSPRPDLVTGGDALVQVKPPAAVQLSRLTVRLNGQDVTTQLTADLAGHSLRGLVGGMVDGDNKLTVDGAGLVDSLRVVNHPITGPVLAGPLQTPYECRTVESGLGAPLDANCTAAQRIEYFYRSTDAGNPFKPLADPAGARPADLMRTQTIEGRDVPYIVRVDSGTINRTIYRIAVLDDPTTATLDPATWKPGAGWNGRFMVSFGGGAGTAYHQGVNQAVNVVAANPVAIGRGFAHVISTELVNQTRGNAVLQGETLMMIKEYFIERYGVPKWTVGSGGSGGAIQQLLITEMYPGLLDGLQPSLAFPDGALHIADCGLLNSFYAKDPATWTEAKKAAVDGFSPGTCSAWVASFVPIIQAARVANCGIDPAKVYNPVTNPTGARCTPQDTRVNVLGKDPQTGFARRPLDNVGLQYGLGALNRGAITVKEFLDLNEAVGGWDIDGNIISQRTVADPIALKASYESGLNNGGGGGLANVPILHFRSYNDALGDIHSRQNDFNIRARLIKANGNANNQVIWVGPDPRITVPGFSLPTLALDAMTRWLDAMAADPAPPSPAKVAKYKPAEAVDACFSGTGVKIVEPASFDNPNTTCNSLYPLHSEPRMVAGAPLTNDIGKCQLKPVTFSDWTVSFSFLEKIRAMAIFAGGVCDFTKPGVGQVPLRGTYQNY